MEAWATGGYVNVVGIVQSASRLSAGTPTALLTRPSFEQKRLRLAGGCVRFYFWWQIGSIFLFDT